MTNRNITRFTGPSPDAKSLLFVAAERLKLSARGYFKIIKIAHTIADLLGDSDIMQEHITEALQYRM